MVSGRFAIVRRSRRFQSNLADVLRMQPQFIDRGFLDAVLYDADCAWQCLAVMRSRRTPKSVVLRSAHIKMRKFGDSAAQTKANEVIRPAGKHALGLVCAHWRFPAGAWNARFLGQDII